jgi:hypothetical protein
MAKITIMQCDLCERASNEDDDKGKPVNVETHRVALDQDAVDLEVCDGCWTTLRTSEVNHIFDVGRAVPRRGPRSKPKADHEALPEQGKRGPGRPRKGAEPGLAAVKA